MPDTPNPLAEYLAALAGGPPWDASHRRVAHMLQVSEGTLCRWLATGPTHREPSSWNVVRMRDLLARLEAAKR